MTVYHFSPDPALVIESEGSFRSALLSEGTRSQSRRAINCLGKSYKIIYVSRYAGKRVSRIWLEKQNYPSSVILPWTGAPMFAKLKKRGVQLHAIIGSSAVISAAASYFNNRYTFEPTADGQTVKNWDEVLMLLSPDKCGGKK